MGLNITPSASGLAGWTYNPDQILQPSASQFHTDNTALASTTVLQLSLRAVAGDADLTGFLSTVAVRTILVFVDASGKASTFAVVSIDREATYVAYTVTAVSTNSGNWNGTYRLSFAPAAPATSVTTNRLGRGFLGGGGLTVDATTSKLDIAAGEVRDDSNTLDITLAAIVKSNASTWAVGTGNGGLDTGSVAASTWYAVYAILRADTGISDALFSLSGTAPTMPTGYAYKRRIGWVLTDGSKNFVPFTQDGDHFAWATPVLDVNSTTGTSSASYTLASVPPQRMLAELNVTITHASQLALVYIRDGTLADLAPSATVAPLSTLRVNVAAVANSETISRYTTMSGSNAQIAARSSQTSTTFLVATLGWFDKRGQS